MGSLLVAVGQDGPVGQPVRADVPVAVYDEILSRETADVVCLIGHSPFLDRWAQAWTGTAVDFKPGSMALFDFDVHGGRIGSASLLFYAHPKALKFLGPSYKE